MTIGGGGIAPFAPSGYALAPYPINKILKKTSLDLSSFLDFNFDGRPIKFQIHSCRGNIVEINV